MKVTFNISNCSDDLNRFASKADFETYLRGFDGVELIYVEPEESDKLSSHSFVIEPKHVIGFHMRYFPSWIDLWRGNKDALIREFDHLENVERIFGGCDREALVRVFREDLKLAHQYEAEYVVFHVSQASIEETFTWRYRHTDEEVISASSEILNEVFADEDGSIILLLENLWQPGLTFTSPDNTRRLLEKINYPNTGLMLDTGHLMHTDTNLASEEEALCYIHQRLDEHGGLMKKIRGVHLHQSLTGDYSEAVTADPPVMSPTFAGRMNQMYSHAFKVDRHLPFTCSGVDLLIERINPDYLTFEFVTSDREQHARYLKMQWDALAPRVLPLGARASRGSCEIG
ncbi:MAG: TIM barrel protein [Clostridiaceae bacterium]|jgi:hypothetical protein|nr:TIM barrel protein [Clostridiaceae bacterium]